jgi:hypothetical protein
MVGQKADAEEDLNKALVLDPGNLLNAPLLCPIRTAHWWTLPHA